jgi:hypothetical protein
MPKSEGSWVLDVVGVIAIIAILVSLGSLGLRLTGNAIDTGIINVTVEASANINFTSDKIDFGSGRVNLGSSNAALESNDTAATNGNWSWGSAEYLVLENIGNVNITVELKTNSNSTTMIGGTNPQYLFKFENVEAGSMIGGGLTQNVWSDANISSPGTLLGNLSFADDKDTIRIAVRLVIPSDSKTGTLTDTVTATGTAV